MAGKIQDLTRDFVRMRQKGWWDGAFTEAVIQEKMDSSSSGQLQWSTPNLSQSLRANLGGQGTNWLSENPLFLQLFLWIMPSLMQRILTMGLEGSMAWWSEADQRALMLDDAQWLRVWELLMLVTYLDKIPWEGVLRPRQPKAEKTWCIAI